MKKLLFPLVIMLMFFSAVKAEFVNNIVVNGNKRVSPETIILLGDVEKDKEYTDTILNNIINELYKTNFFSDIKLEILNGTLHIEVTENKIIQTIEINGIKANKIKDLIKEHITLKNKSPYNKFFVSKDLNIIKNSLKSIGYYFVDVKSSIIENNNNTVNLIYDVELGKKAMIDKIVFLGNNNFKDNKMRKIIVSEEAKFWKFISNKKYIDRERLELDKRLIKNFYLNNGYYKVIVNEAFAQYTEKEKFLLTYSINEGSKYYINETKLILPDSYDKSNFSKIIQTLEKLKKKKYSLIKLSKIINELDKITLLKQYEFISASINEKIVDNNRIDISLIIEETAKSYIERIDIVGNNITQETVIRNEFVVDEGDAFNELLLTKTINNLKARNLFKTVEAEVVEGSKPGLKLVKVEVEEKPTGEISLGAGVGSEGGSIGFSVSENNYLGRGIQVKSSLQVTEERITALLAVTNPNYNYTDNSLSTMIRSTVTDRMTNYGYESTNTGFSIGTNFEQYDDFRISPSLAVGFESLKTNQTASANLKKQEGTYFDATIFYQLDYDKRNQKFQTSDGFRSKFTQSIPIFSEDYALLNGYEFSKYEQFNDIIGSVSIYTRAVNSINDEDVRISNRLYLPSRKLRGFEPGKIGPTDSGDFVGGNYATAVNIVTTLPKLFATVQNAEFQFFFDAANVWGVDYSDTIDDSNKLRTSTGVAVNWYTPIGPLNFSLAQPITKAKSDKTESFRFNLGTTF